MGGLFLILWILSFYQNAAQHLAQLNFYSPFKSYCFELDQSKKVKNVEVIWQAVTRNACAELMVDDESCGTKLVQSATDSWKVERQGRSGKINFMGLVLILNFKVSYYKTESVPIPLTAKSLTLKNWYYPGARLAVAVQPGRKVSVIKVDWHDAGGDAAGILYVNGKPFQRKEADSGKAVWILNRSIESAWIEVREDVIQISGITIDYESEVKH
ncbi:MAG: hypothetical protein PHW04_09415 [Candidatus Wallbacteria bacterium]|nr:hypothetical protein [Candidatus Wallbacteria bacterium]